jgi:hypothetical protein
MIDLVVMCVPAHPERSKGVAKAPIPLKLAGIGLASGGLQR